MISKGLYHRSITPRRTATTTSGWPLNSKPQNDWMIVGYSRRDVSCSLSLSFSLARSPHCCVLRAVIDTHCTLDAARALHREKEGVKRKVVETFSALLLLREWRAGNAFFLDYSLATFANFETCVQRKGLQRRPHKRDTRAILKCLSPRGVESEI